MKLNELIKQALPFFREPVPALDVQGISMDTRKTEDGDLFVCIQGTRFDSHELVGEAEAQGAVAIIAEKPVNTTLPVLLVNDSRTALAQVANAFFGYPSDALHLTGVTGTNGKTTTTYIIQSIYECHAQKTATMGTVGLRIGEATYPLPNTTPESLTVQQSLRQMMNEGVERAVMEVSSHALVEGRTRGCQFNVAVFTNLSQDHLNFHSSMEAYKDAKRLLFSSLPAWQKDVSETYAVLNVDDPVFSSFRNVTQAAILTYGIRQKADVMAKDLSLQGHGTSFTLVTPEGTCKVTLPLAGTFNVYNTLAAAAACYAGGVAITEIKAGLERIQGVPGRFELVDAGQGFPVIVDYAHTPDSLKNVLQTARELTKNRLLVVCGCGGDRDRTKRPKMAQVAVHYAEVAIFTNDNPRTESPEQIFSDMIEPLDESKHQFTVIEDRREAIYRAINDAQEGDVILIAGKGHETYQIIGDHTVHFDDREEAREALKERLR
ncbi:UDP-N-acetylmuramoyl-L-alanyl-D-glutamate--2,6-diaminopimelate ligase [Bacillaceae bacterium SIJ1]|uniref:UDP-N-acetylmuramoyl-L-alanyl-D-glutamate--2, 6-diaminopimelate ligase n=1 Tax=Litoribacterium kuwaitense TaxID=1398745 RepID=UPI0013E9E31D|nr:UDP-N-acetylmuramoyl-L-alanyl-D-glutamate--2,6-diaminopimelate ligase [Litoribacterium kuwaitense]NGP44346.1 UDP-N-acetylmuramoyl-L-alanyl-D-glutamate--2,6-diaminopimelate ligase [Litoribacterium kuwaitense]